MPKSCASEVEPANVIAIPAPIEADPPEAAWPSAVAVAWDDSCADCAMSPPTVTKIPAGMFAFALAFEKVSATAAATLIGPPLVDAEGAGLEPEPPPPAAPTVLFPRPRSLPPRP